ncbi:MAG: hypothetical protein GOU98_01155 [Candidatus Altiarchaeota archaeon]|nr:hypothetical protein [Candidatus Altiarchaeota archaeon]
MSNKRNPFSGGVKVKARQATVNSYKIFLLLIAIHGAIFIMPWDAKASIILLLALIKGWTNGV